MEIGAAQAPYDGDTGTTGYDQATMHMIFHDLLHFEPEHKEQYYLGGRTPDCTTVARAAEAGDLEFLKWCAEERGLGREFDDTALGYAEKGGHAEVVEYVRGVIEMRKKAEDSTEQAKDM